MRPIIDIYERTMFDYGTADCCTFVADCLTFMYGENPIKGLKYRSESDANNIIRYHGDLVKTINHYLGPPEGKDYEPKNGDVAMAMSGNGPIAAMVYADRLVLKTENGLTDWPLERGLVFWSTSCRKR